MGPNLRQVKNTPQIAPSKTECLLSSTSAIGFSLIAAHFTYGDLTEVCYIQSISKGVSEWLKNMFDWIFNGPLIQRNSGKPKNMEVHDLGANKDVFLSTFGQSLKHEF